MSIKSEINRISNNVNNAIQAVEEKGVSVPEGANSDNLPELINEIFVGYPDAVRYSAQSLTDAQKSIARENIGAVSETEANALIADELAKRGQLKPEFANSIEECTDTTKLYVLPDGYVYAYMTKTIPGGVEEKRESIKGLLKDTRLSTSGGGTSTKSGYATTPFIDFSQYPIDAEIHLSGAVWAAASVGTSGHALATFDENKNNTVAQYLYEGTRSDTNGNYTYTGGSDGSVVFKIADTSLGLKFKYVRFSGQGTPDTAVVEVVYTKQTDPTTVTDWTNTGHAFVPADYEDRIIELEAEVAELKALIMGG